MCQAVLHTYLPITNDMVKTNTSGERKYTPSTQPAREERGSVME